MNGSIRALAAPFFSLAFALSAAGQQPAAPAPQPPTPPSRSCRPALTLPFLNGKP